MVHQSPAGQVAGSFAGLLRQLRADARLTQEELAEKAGLSPRSISDLERGVSRTARKQTACLLADALAIAEPARTAFVAAARGRGPVTDVLAARDGSAAEAPAATMVWHACDDQGLSLHPSWLIRILDAMTAAAAQEGGAVTGVLLIGVTASAASETTPAPPEPGGICMHSRGRRRVVDSSADADSELGADSSAGPRQRPIQGLGRRKRQEERS